MADNFKFYNIYDCNYKLDYKVYLAKFLSYSFLAIPVPYVLFKKTPWAKICDQIKANTSKRCAIPYKIEQYTYEIMAVVIKTIDQYILKAKSCLYIKRW